MEFKTLVNTSVQQILETFNESFLDYFVPFKLTLDQLEQKIKSEKINLQLSAGVFDNDNLIGFILHGQELVDGVNLLYNGGTGVIPSYRGNGLTRQMYQYLFPRIKSAKVDQLVLEVITKNKAAIKSYEKVGFEIVRVFDCFRGKVKPIENNLNLEIREIEKLDWTIAQSFWEVKPSWQNSKHVIEEDRGATRLRGAYVNKTLAGYIITNATANRIKQIAVNPSFRRKGIAKALVCQIAQSGENEVSIINVDNKSITLVSFFNALEMNNFLQQYEMKMDMDDFIRT